MEVDESREVKEVEEVEEVEERSASPWSVYP
jgi:hypothetical protein